MSANNTQTNNNNRKEWVHCKDFDPSKVTFGVAKDSKNAMSKRVYLKYNGERLFIETFRHRNPFGLSRGLPSNEEQYNKKITCTLSFDLNSKRGKQFYQKMQAFQERLIDVAYENRVEWGLVPKAKKDKKSREDIEELMNPIVKIPMDDEDNVIDTYPPTFRVEFYTVKDEEGKVKGVTTEVYDQNGEKVQAVDENTIPPGSEAKCIMGASYIYVIPTTSRWGLTWRLNQMRVFPGSALPTGRCLIQDDPEDSSDEGDNTTTSATNTTSSSSRPPVAQAPASEDGSDGAGGGSENAEAGEVADAGSESEEEDTRPRKPRLSLKGTK